MIFKLAVAATVDKTRCLPRVKGIIHFGVRKIASASGKRLTATSAHAQPIIRHGAPNIEATSPGPRLGELGGYSPTSLTLSTHFLVALLSL